MEQRIWMSAFTFGSDHRLPTGEQAADEWVLVVDETGTADRRALFMAWLGSNAFGFEYDEPNEWAQVWARHYDSKDAAYTINVSKPQPRSGYAS